MRDPLPFFEECDRRYGPIFHLHLGPLGRWVFVSTPELVRQVYAAEASALSAGRAKARLFAPIVGTTSSLVLDGAPHHARRRLLGGAFRGERLLEATDAMQALTRAKLKELPRATWLSAHPPMQSIAFGAILAALFGGEWPFELEASLAALMQTAVASKLLTLRFLRLDLGRFSPWGRVLAAIERADRAIFAELERRRRVRDARGILGMLLEARDADGHALSDRQVRDELVTMVVAGHEITALSLAWFFAAIGREPAVAARLQAEIRAATGGGGVSQDNIARMPYLDAAIRESLRRNSAVANGSARQLETDLQLGAHTLPAGTILNVCIHVLHHRPELYPAPRSFDPSRFLGRKVDPHEWLPFGGGSRRCLGMALALLEMKVIAATLLERSSVETAEPELAATRRGAFLYPADGGRIRLTDLPALAVRARARPPADSSIGGHP
jgi:unspecific monooxygenase